MKIAADRVVILTGAAGGLGRVMTLGLLESGARVVAVDLGSAAGRVEELVRDAERAGGGARLATIAADVGEVGAAERIVDHALATFGRIDALVNNAGVFINSITPHVISAPPKFYDVTTDQWLTIINANLNGAFFLARAVAPHLLAQKSGRIVNVVTSYTTMVRAGLTPYGPSKAGLEAATANWSGDLAGTGVTVNALLPGRAADTEMIPAADVPDRSTLVPASVMIAPVVWLTSDASAAWTGYRFRGNAWDPAVGDDVNVQRAGELAAWRTTTELPPRILPK